MTQKRIVYFEGYPESRFQYDMVNKIAHRLGASFVSKTCQGVPMAYCYRDYKMVGIVVGPNSETLWEKKITDLLNKSEE